MIHNDQVEECIWTTYLLHLPPRGVALHTSYPNGCSFFFHYDFRLLCSITIFLFSLIISTFLSDKTIVLVSSTLLHHSTQSHHRLVRTTPYTTLKRETHSQPLLIYKRSHVYTRAPSTILGYSYLY